jgi:hypothetical protein
MKVWRLRKAYQRVFMPSISNGSSFEDRLAELVSPCSSFCLLPPFVHVLFESKSWEMEVRFLEPLLYPVPCVHVLV